MGKAKNGIFGPINGKVANVVFYTSKGIDIIRSIGDRGIFKPTAALQANNNNFGIMVKFLKKVKPFIKEGFRQKAAGTVYSYHNLAASYNLKNAMHNNAGKPEILFDKLLLSSGNCLNANSPAIELLPEGLEFKWDVADLPYPASQDRAMMLVYFPEIDECVMNTDAAKRIEGRDILPLQPAYCSQHMEVYLAFKASGHDDVSTSQYLGRIN